MEEQSLLCERHDPGALRKALGSFATGVTIITAPPVDGGEALGMTVNSFSSVSLEPALVLWSIKGSNPNVGRFGEGSHFGINVLAGDQAELCRHFAQPRAGLLDEVAHRPGIAGIPLFDLCCATFECVTQSSVDGGDHLIIIGKVLRFQRAEARAPLVFHGGRQYTIDSLSACG